MLACSSASPAQLHCQSTATAQLLLLKVAVDPNVNNTARNSSCRGLASFVYKIACCAGLHSHGVCWFSAETQAAGGAALVLRC